MPFSCCSASFCKNNRYNVTRRGLDITFHTFPPQQYPIAKQWVQFCKREEDWIPHKHSVLCSVHFREDDFQMVNSPVIKQGRRMRHINVNAVPTIVTRTAITVSKREKLDNVRKQLLEKLYDKPDEASDQPTGNDHTYSEAKTEQAEKKGPVDGCRKSIFFLQRYPNVCAFCLRILNEADLFLPVTHYHDALECTIEQKFDELTGDPMDQEDRSDIQQLLPEKVCNECVTMVVKFHQYQRQLECIKKFSTGIAHLLYGNQEPLENLYQDQGPYLVNILKRLDTAQGTRVNQSLEQLLEEVTSYGNVKQSMTTSGQHSENNMSLELCSTTDGFLADDDSGFLRVTEEVIIGNDETNSTQLYTCPYKDMCNVWFSTHSAIERHVQEDHKTFTCHVCGFKIAFYDLYKKHMESHAIARALLLSHKTKDGSLERQESNCEQSDQSEDVSPQRPQQRTKGSWVCGVCLGRYANDLDFNNHQCFPPRKKIATPKDILMESSTSKSDTQMVESDEWDDDTGEAHHSSADSTNTSGNSVKMLEIEFLR